MTEVMIAVALLCQSHVLPIKCQKKLAKCINERKAEITRTSDGKKETIWMASQTDILPECVDKMIK